MEKSKMLYDVVTLKQSIDVSIKYPDIEFYEEFKLESFRELKCMTRDQAFRFVALIIDPGSPLFPIREITQRCEQAIKMLHVELDEKELKDVIDLKFPELRKAILRYFIMLNSYQYEQWFSQKMLFHELTALLQKPVSGKDQLNELDKRIKYSAQLTVLGKEIMKKEAELFDDDRMRDFISRTATASKIINWAEVYAEVDANDAQIDDDELDDEL